MHHAISRSAAAHAAPRRHRFITTFALAAALLAGLLASGSARPQAVDPSTRCGTTPNPDEVLRRLNLLRSRGAVCHQAGSLAVAAPVRWSDSLAAVAAAQSHDMALLRQMRHRDRLDRALGERLAAAGYRFSTAVENIAVGYDSLDQVVDAWVASEHHCDNMLNGAVLELGLACSDDATAPAPGEGRYWTLVLGAPRRAAR